MGRRRKNRDQFPVSTSRRRHHHNRSTDWSYPRHDFIDDSARTQRERDNYNRQRVTPQWEELWDSLQQTQSIIDYQKSKDKQLLEKAKLKIAEMYPGRKIITDFKNILLEIHHLIPLYPHVGPELFILNTVEENSILLGRVKAFSIRDRCSFVQDTNEGGIHFKHAPGMITGIGKEEHFIAIKNPNLTWINNEHIGFCTDEDVCYIDPESLNNDWVVGIVILCLVIVIAILLSAAFVYSK